MKKMIFLALLLIPASLFSEDAREQRWISRIEKLEKYKGEINIKSEFESGTASLIDEEIGAAKDFLGILNKYKTGDDSVKEANRKYSLKEIEDIAANITGPAVSVFYISEMIKNSENRAVISFIKDEINKYSTNITEVAQSKKML